MGVAIEKFGRGSGWVSAARGVVRAEPQSAGAPHERACWQRGRGHEAVRARKKSELSRGRDQVRVGVVREWAWSLQDWGAS